MRHLSSQQANAVARRFAERIADANRAPRYLQPQRLIGLTHWQGDCLRGTGLVGVQSHVLPNGDGALSTGARGDEAPATLAAGRVVFVARRATGF